MSVLSIAMPHAKSNLATMPTPSVDPVEFPSSPPPASVETAPSGEITTNLLYSVTMKLFKLSSAMPDELFTTARVVTGYGLYWLTARIALFLKSTTKMGALAVESSGSTVMLIGVSKPALVPSPFVELAPIPPASVVTSPLGETARIA